VAAPQHGGNHVAFHMEDGVELVLFRRSALAELNQGIADMSGANEVILSLYAESRAEVDEVLAKAMAAGGTQAGDTEGADWGYHGHFRDPDGHLWEIVSFGNGQ
jgi:predicted lactoylglutathione lyase